MDALLGAGGRLGAAACAALLALAACADEPVQLASRYTPRDSFSDAGRAPSAARPRCRVLLSGVRDLRDDPQAAGVFADRFVHAADAPDWLRSGLLSLSSDPQLDLSDQTPAAAADLIVNVDLLKLYLLPINEAKSANVVVRVHYSGPAAPPGDVVYRGAFTSLNWSGAGSEARGAMDIALSRVLGDVDRALASRCAGRASSGAQ